MSEILLVPVDATAPVEPPSESSESVVPEDEPVPKRGRGRPPGAKNKKSVVEPPTPRNAAPRVPRIPTPQEDEEEFVAPPPLVKKRPKALVVPRVEEELEPPSPRAQRRRIHIDAQTRRYDQHTERVRGYSTLLDNMLAY
jgi:hypothetical protein